MEKEKTACFTGHRSINKEDLPQLQSTLYSSVARLIANGYDCFICGGAKGFDTMAARCVIAMRCRFPHIKLHLVLPCRDQTAKWKSITDISSYKEILGQCDSIEYISELYSEECMHLRNRRMVDLSSFCIAYLKAPRGGTLYTCKYAKKQGLEVRNLADITLPDLNQLSLLE